MNLSELILEKRIYDIKIGESIDKFPDLELISAEEGDIPGIFGFYVEDLFFEVIVINKVVIGIQFDFQYEIKKPNFFNIEGIEIKLTENTSLQNFIEYLKKVNLEFEIIESKFESLKVVLKKSNTSFYFDDDNQKLFKLNSYRR